MLLEHLQLNIDKRVNGSGLEASLVPGVSSESIALLESRLNQKLPDPVRQFYLHYNGLVVTDPLFVILPVEELFVDERSMIHFATADGVHRICFDCSQRNEANQWNIVDSATGEQITLSMASFWSNKIWKWIDWRLAFWRGEV